MSKASDRLYDEIETYDCDPEAIAWILAKIRARRDEIIMEHRCRGAAWGEVFARLFNDGAEFGPDAPLCQRTLLEVREKLKAIEAIMNVSITSDSTREDTKIPVYHAEDIDALFGPGGKLGILEK